MFVWCGKERRRKILHATAVVIVLAFLYFLVLQPILAFTIIPSIEHSGVSLYEEGTYLDYEKADEFHSLLSKLSFLKDAKVTGFSYKNSFLRDTIYYGRFPDAFMMELFLGKDYEAAKEEVVANSFSVTNMEGLSLYYVDECAGKDCFCIALYDEKQTAICVLLTDCEYTSVDMVLIRHFPLPGM